MSTEAVDIDFNERIPRADPIENGLRERVLLPLGPCSATVCGNSEFAELLSLFRLLASWDSHTECHGPQVKVDLTIVNAKPPLEALADVRLVWPEGEIAIRRCAVFQKANEPPWDAAAASASAKRADTTA